MIYALTNDHALLTRKVKELEPTVFQAQVETAEVLLRLNQRSKITKEEDVDRVHLALAHQVNFQVEMGLDPLIQESASSSHSRQSISYRDRHISPVAMSILAGVSGIGSYSGKILSVRNQKGDPRWGSCGRARDLR